MISTVLFVGLTALFFMIDLCVHGFYAAPRSFLVATFFYTLVGTDTPYWRLGLLLLGMLYESFLVTGIIGTELLLIISLAVLLSYIRQHIHLFILIDALLVLISVGITAAYLFRLFSTPKLAVVNPLFTHHALVRVIILHFISAVTMVYYSKR